MEANITLKQQKALEYIYDILISTGFPPSMAELREGLGVVSNQSVINFLTALEKGGFIKREEGQARGLKILPLGCKIIGKESLLPVVGISSCGPYIEDVETFKWMALRSAMAHETIKESEDKLYVIQVHGDSMINAGIAEGDILLVKKTGEYRSGDIVIARSDDGTTVKRFISEPNGCAYLRPENPAYKNIPIFEDTYFDGKVIANLTSLKRTYG